MAASAARRPRDGARLPVVAGPAPGTVPAAVAAVVALLVLAALATAAGGYFASSQLVAGAVVLATVGVVLLSAPQAWRPSPAGWIAVTALAGYAAWGAVSRGWTLDRPGAEHAVRLDVLYVGILALGLLAAGTSRDARRLVRGVLALVVGVVGLGLLARLAPDLVAEEGSGLLTHRLSHPLTYFNAYGALAAIGAVLAVGLSAYGRASERSRALTAAAAVLLVVGLHLSFSRGALAAFLAGLAALLVLAPERAGVLAAVTATAAGAVPALLVLAGLDALTDDPGLGAGQAAEGARFAPVLLACLAVAAAVRVLIARIGREAPPAGEVVRAAASSRLAAGAGVLVTLAVSIAVFASDRVDGEVVRGFDGARSLVAGQLDVFGATTVTDGGTGATRLPTLQGTRSDLYRVAVDAGAAHPLRGEGAGAFGVRYAHDRALVQEVRNAHSLYLETWAERGLVGVGLLGVLVAAVLRAAWSRRRRTSRLGRTEAAAAGAAVVVGLVHAGMDWDWQMPALTGVVLLLAAVVLAPVRSSHRLSA